MLQHASPQLIISVSYSSSSSVYLNYTSAKMSEIMGKRMLKLHEEPILMSCLIASARYITVTSNISNALLVVPETLTENGITNLLTVNYGKFVALSLAKSSQVAFNENSYYGVLAGSTTGKPRCV